MDFNVEQLVRENIRKLTPYSSARDEFHGEAKIFVDANENALGSPLTRWYNRYPDPHQHEVKKKLSTIKGVPVGNIFLGNGSDEVIDILFRAFCEPRTDNVIICPPTYGMYEVSANINNVPLKKIKLKPDYQLDLPTMEEAIDANTKIIWLCSPNNPTANSIYREDIDMILNNFNGLVVLDEAYINFSKQRSFVQELGEYPNLVVMQTLSKAWGLAALRIGMAFASEYIVGIMNKIKPPYNISQAAQELALKALDEVEQVNDMIRILVEERELLKTALGTCGSVLHIHPSDANFLLVKVTDANGIYQYLLNQGIVVRDRSKVELCEGCLRITVGTPQENKMLVEALSSFPVKSAH